MRESQRNPHQDSSVLKGKGKGKSWRQPKKKDSFPIDEGEKTGKRKEGS
jgi:hypothetical protein